MRRVAAVALAALLACSPLAAQSGASNAANPLLVSTSWLADHLRDPGLAIIHVGTDASFAQGHIPGARLIPR